MENIINNGNNEINKKKVHFNPHITINYLHVWTFAYQKARIDGNIWCRAAVDRNRFNKRCNDISKKLDSAHVFDNLHREKIFLERIFEENTSK